MNKKAKEPFLVSRIVNMFLGNLTLVLLLVMLFKESGKEVLEILIFALAAVINFISAIICFMQQRMVRGNIYAMICAVFLIVAVFFAVRYFVFV